MAHTGVFNVDGVGSNLEKYDGHDLTSATPSGSKGYGDKLWDGGSTLANSPPDFRDFELW